MHFTARVISGSGHGRTIGYPTANLAITEEMRCSLKRFGVYAAYVTVRGKRYKAALFWGRRTLFGDTEPVCEALLIDFEGDIAGEEALVTVFRFLRDSANVEDEAHLKRLIEDDIKQVEQIL